MKVSELAKKLDVTADTVRYYTRIGCLDPVKSSTNGYKHYGQNDQDRLRFILNARQLGFSVNDISKILEETAKGNTGCPLAREILDQRLKETEDLFQRTLALRNRMYSALQEWESKPDEIPTDRMVCHLIEGLDGPELRGS